MALRIDTRLSDQPETKSANRQPAPSHQQVDGILDRKREVGLPEYSAQDQTADALKFSREGEHII